MKDILSFSPYRTAAIVVSMLCFLLFVDAAIPQLEISLFGDVVVSNGVIKAGLLALLFLGCVLHPTLRLSKLPLSAWMVCVGYLAVELGYLVFGRGMSVVDVLVSYNAYYSLLLIGPALLVFRDSVTERFLIRCTVVAFLICTSISIAQYVTQQPILHLESPDGSFAIESPSFLGELRAFSLFSSAMNFGIFCAFCGALGVALSRKQTRNGTLLTCLSALASFTTLTRLSYLVFICACIYSAILTFGKNPKRARWYPLLFFFVGIATVLAGLYSLVSSGTSNLQDASSLLERLEQWSYYYGLILHSTFAQQVFGLGIVQVKKILPVFPMVIDNVPIALILHIGLLGLVLFSVLMVKMWKYLRQEALLTQQPFIVAAASLWATLACAGIFNIVFSSFGIVFAFVILCEKRGPSLLPHKLQNHRHSKKATVLPQTAEPVKYS